MPTTMNLLDAALHQAAMPEWTRRLGLSKQALYNARDRGHLSPAIAGALAEELGQDPQKWIVVAALESERDSACKERMLKRLRAKVFSFVSAAARALSPKGSPRSDRRARPQSARG